MDKSHLKQRDHRRTITVEAALAEGFRYDPTNKPPLRPGCTVRLRKGEEHCLARIDHEDHVVLLKTTLKRAVEEIVNAKEPEGAQETASPDTRRSADPGMGQEAS